MRIEGLDRGLGPTSPFLSHQSLYGSLAAPGISFEGLVAGAGSGGACDFSSDWGLGNALEGAYTGQVPVTAAFLKERQDAGTTDRLSFEFFVLTAMNMEDDHRAEVIKKRELTELIRYEHALKTKLASVFNLPVDAQQAALDAGKKHDEERAADLPPLNLSVLADYLKRE